MSADRENNEDVGLWECLHDGSLSNLIHDRLARMITLVIDVPYIRDFHGMPSASRFLIKLHDVLTVESLNFNPWPGETIIPSDLAWAEQQAIRLEMLSKGFLSSSDWASFCARIESDSDYEFSNAYLATTAAGHTAFVADLAEHVANEYPTLRIAAGHVSFWIDSNQEITVSKFLSLGKAYWDHWSARAANHAASTKHD